MNLVRQLLVSAVVFLLGVALFALLAQLGITLGLGRDTARWLAFGGLAAYALAFVIISRRGQR